MKNWRRWAWIMAWLSWLTGSLTAAQVSPRYVLPGGTVTWTLPSGFVVGKVRVGTTEVTPKVAGNTLTFRVPDRTIEGVVPLQVTVGSTIRSAQVIVVGPDAEVGHDSEGRPSGDVTVIWLECDRARTDSTIAELLNGTLSSLPHTVAGIERQSVRSYVLNGATGSCQCRVVEVNARVTLKTIVPAERADALGAVLDKLRTLTSSESQGDAVPSKPQPLVVRSVMTHGLYHAGPDHVPLKDSGSGATIPFDPASLKLPPSGTNKVLVAILDTGMSNNVRGKFSGSLVDNNSTKFNLTAPDDNFNVQSQVNGISLKQGSGHGTPAAWIAHQVGGIAVDILPIGVCDSNGLCRDSEIIQGLCSAAEFYRINQKIYSGGLVINLSLGGFTPSDVLQTVLNEVTTGMRGVPVKPWVVAAAGNYDPKPQNGWSNFTKTFPYARVYPAGYGDDGWAPSGQKPSFTMNDRVIAVGSLEHLKSAMVWQVADTSMRSDPKNYVRICAPGRNVLSTDNAGNAAWYSGTSYAAPVVSGLLARSLTNTPFMDWRNIRGTPPAPIRTACP